MNLNNLIKKSFKTVIENPSITLFLVLFLILVNFFTSYILTAKTGIIAAILSVCLFFLIAVFLSGWFQVAKTVSECDKRKNLYPVFLEGAGGNLLSVVLGMIVYIIAFSLFVFLAKSVAMALFGKLDFLNNAPLIQNSSAIIEYINNLSINEQGAIYGWYFSFICTMAVFNFLALFYFPAMFFTKDKNALLKPFIAIKDSLFFTFKHFFGVLFISVFIHVTYFFLALISTAFSKFALVSILVLFCYIYFLSLVVMLIFNYYESKTNSNHRSDCLGENEPLNQISAQN